MAPLELSGGRGGARAALRGLLTGGGGALVVHGEPGIGKTTLVEEVLRTSARGRRVERMAAAESEMELEFSALHQLCAPMLDRLDALPGPRREAMEATFGRSARRAPDQLVVALALLSLLWEVGRERPLVCIVDDAHWLDRSSAQALALVARRLDATPVALVLVACEPPPELASLPQVVVDGLPTARARALLPGPLDRQVRDRLVAETHANPFALLDLRRAELAGGFGVPAALSLPPAAERRAERRLAPLSSEARRLLLVAAAEPAGDPLVLWRAAARLGIDARTETDGLLEAGPQLGFRSLADRVAVYRAASPGERRRVHRALAEATDPAIDPDRCAWHLASAVLWPDEEVAAELARCERFARARAGLPASAAFLARAAELTPDPARRAARALAAAEAKHAAGAPDAAIELLAAARATPLDAIQSARAQRLRARIALSLGRGAEDAALQLLRAAIRLAPLDAELARETGLEALEAATRFELPELRGRALAALRAAGGPADGDEEPAFDMADHERPALAARMARERWDYAHAHELAAQYVREARADGALSALPHALDELAACRLLQGDFAGAEALVAEAGALAKSAGAAPLSHTRVLLAAWCGDALAGARYAEAVLHNGRGRYEDALAAARASAATALALPELIEAAVRSGAEPPLGDVRRLCALTRASGTPIALGVEACARALVSEGDAADRLYQEAIERLEGPWAVAPLARVRLLYGEWLRRERRRRDARAQLRAAQQGFDAFGARAFAERAARELRASGATARRRTDPSAGGLTAQEAQIARMAGDGRSNAEIGTELFISPRTVEYHLHKVFAKLDITSRVQLAGALRPDA